MIAPILAYLCVYTVCNNVIYCVVMFDCALLSGLKMNKNALLFFFVSTTYN